MKKEFTYYQGSWNGEPCMFAVLIVIVGHFEEKDLHFHWYKPFVGQMRQVLEIQYNNRVFYIDNYDGTGFYKVVSGMGGEEYFHRNIKPTKIIAEVPRTKITEYNINLCTWVNNVITIYFLTNGGKAFKKAMEQLDDFKNKELF